MFWLAPVIATEWTLVAGGDLMLNQVNPSPKVFASIAPVVSGADIAYANLEIPLTDKTVATSRKTAAEVRARTQYILKANPKHGAHLDKAGFDVFSLGNNHALDYREAGLKQQLGILQDLEIDYCGAGRNWTEARRTAVLEAGGLKIGFISFLSFNNPSSMRKCTSATATEAGVASLTITGVSDEKAKPMIRSIVARAKKECDLLVVCLHWGIEKQTLPAANQVRLGRMFIDQGADMVLGAHPHVLQPGELYRGKPIVYSLGNLVSPRPASTALYRFNFEGETLKSVDYFPASIGGGRVTLKSAIPSLPTTAVNAEKALLRRYPSKNSERLISRD